MKMSKFMASIWLNNGELARRGGAYVGTIVDVTEMMVRNPYTCQKVLKPVVAFADGQKLLPNIGMLRTLQNVFGDESELWIGKSVRVFQKRVERTDPSTGEQTVRFERAVMESEADALVPEPLANNGDDPYAEAAAPRWTRESPPSESDDSEAAMAWWAGQNSSEEEV
jgi:hypothetical protein